MQVRIAGSVHQAIAPIGPNNTPAPEPIAGVDVAVYEIRSGQVVGVASTNADGTFLVAGEVFSADTTCGFRVARRDHVLIDTGWAMTWSLQDGQPIDIVLPVAGSTVFGTVRTSDGAPDENAAVVKLFAVSLDGEQELVSVAAEGGSYSFAVLVGPHDLVRVKAYQAGANDPFTSSAAHEGPGRIDLVVGGATRGQSELNRVLAAIGDLPTGVTLATLSAAQLAYLANSTSVAPSILATLARASQLANEQELSLAFVYGLGRLGHALSSVELLAHRRQIPESLSRAVADNLIDDGDFATDLAKVDLLRQTRAEALPAFAAATASGVNVLSGSEVAAIATAYLAHEGTLPELWDGLRNNSALGSTSGERQAKVAVAQDALRLDIVTNAHQPLIEALLADRGTGWTSVRELARLSESAWVTRVGSLSSLPAGLARHTRSSLPACRSALHPPARPGPHRSVLVARARADERRPGAELRFRDVRAAARARERRPVPGRARAHAGGQHGLSRRTVVQARGRQAPRDRGRARAAPGRTVPARLDHHRARDRSFLASRVGAEREAPDGRDTDHGGDPGLVLRVHHRADARSPGPLPRGRHPRDAAGRGGAPRARPSRGRPVRAIAHDRRVPSRCARVRPTGTSSASSTRHAEARA